jgi:transposase-like protein
MPWQEVSTMSLRQEFVTMVQHGTVPVSEVCRRFRVSRKTGYKWLAQHGSDHAMSARSLHGPAR